MRTTSIRSGAILPTTGAGTSWASTTAITTTTIRRDELRRWGCSERATATLISHSENLTFRVDDPEREEPTILRVHRPAYHGFAAIRSELFWLQALAQEGGVLTAQPLPAAAGELIQEVGGFGNGPRLAVMFTFLPGAAPLADALPEAFERLGGLTARLHAHARAWRQPEGFVRQSWRFETMLGSRPIWGDWRAGPGMDRARQAVLQRATEQVAARLMAYGAGRERFGLIHADLRLANLLVDGERLQVIDFDDCGFGWYLYDLAAALSFIEHRADVPGLVTAWLRGYRAVAPLGNAEEAMIPTFIMLRRLLLVAWIGSHAETGLAQALGAGFTEGSCVLAERYLGGAGA